MLIEHSAFRYKWAYNQTTINTITIAVAYKIKPKEYTTPS